MVKRFLLAALLAVAPAFAAPDTTTISGTVYLPGGNTPVTSGSIIASLSTSASAPDGGSSAVVAGRIAATITPRHCSVTTATLCSADGDCLGGETCINVTISLVPNDVMTPSGTYYIVAYSAGQPTAAQWTERWTVTTAPDPIVIGNVTRIDLPTGTAPPVSRLQDEGTDITRRTRLNFVGAGVTCVDDSGNSRTNCTITSGGGGTPGGVDQEVQVNASSAFGVAPGFTANTTTGTVSTKDISIVGTGSSLFTPYTTDNATGITYKGGVAWMHDFVNPTSFVDASISTDANARGIFLGFGAGNFTMSGTSPQGKANVGIGHFSSPALTTGWGNNAVGARSMKSMTSGFLNDAHGYEAMRDVTTASNSAAFGVASLFSANGLNNSGFGSNAGYSDLTGNNNTYLGAEANQTIAGPGNYSNVIAIGYQAVADASNKTVIGNASTTVTELKGDVIISTATPGDNDTSAASTAFVTAAAAAADGTIIREADLGAGLQVSGGVAATLSNEGDFLTTGINLASGTTCASSADRGKLTIGTGATPSNVLYYCSGGGTTAHTVMNMASSQTVTGTKTFAIVNATGLASLSGGLTITGTAPTSSVGFTFNTVAPTFNAGYTLAGSTTSTKVAGTTSSATASLKTVAPASTFPGIGIPAAWQANTTYTIPAGVSNDSGKQYRLITNGTSAASGGPTGTGADITDNTAHWKYLGVVHAGTAKYVDFCYTPVDTGNNYDGINGDDSELICVRGYNVTDAAGGRIDTTEYGFFFQETWGWSANPLERRGERFESHVTPAGTLWKPWTTNYSALDSETPIVDMTLKTGPSDIGFQMSSGQFAVGGGANGGAAFQVHGNGLMELSGTSGSAIIMEGATADGSQITLTLDEPSNGDRYLYVPNIAATSRVVVSALSSTSGPAAWAANGVTCATACTNIGQANCADSIPMDGTNTALGNCTGTTGHRLCECY